MRTMVFLFAAFAVVGCGDDTTSSSTGAMDMSAGCNVPITCAAGQTVACVNGHNVCQGGGDMAHAATTD